MGNGRKKETVVLSHIHGEKCWPMVDKVSPCEEACPIHMDIPSYVIALAQGKIKEALTIIRETNPFPSICGRVCHHPCEAACTRALVDRPVAIEWLKRYIGQFEQGNGKGSRGHKGRKGERVAIIGSGPAGLTAAHDLVKKGYRVSVFEALPVAGGMLAAGIPDFNLPKDIVAEEVDYIKALGVEIKTNTGLGRDLTLEDLRHQGYKAVLLAVGAWKSLELDIPGVGLKGVRQALPFLRAVKLGDKPLLKGRVLVIGGGNVAVDAARTALRLGSAQVSMACLEDKAGMPAFAWEISRAEAEGVEIHPSLAPQEIKAKSGGKVKEVVFKKVTELGRDKDGRLKWTLASGPEAEVALEADTVIVAIGQVPDRKLIDDLKPAGADSLRIDPETPTTNVAGIFAAGDAAAMPGTIVGAIASGHQAAQAIDHYLRGRALKTKAGKKVREVFKVNEDMALPSFLIKKDRWEMPVLSDKDARRSFGETDLGYTDWQAREEAKRCLNCRMCGNCIFERGQLCFETSTRLL